MLPRFVTGFARWPASANANAPALVRSASRCAPPLKGGRSRLAAGFWRSTGGVPHSGEVSETEENLPPFDFFLPAELYIPAMVARKGGMEYRRFEAAAAASLYAAR